MPAPRSRLRRYHRGRCSPPTSITTRPGGMSDPCEEALLVVVGEVLIVLGARPGAAPVPADVGKGLHRAIAGVDHSGCVFRPVDIVDSGGGKDRATGGDVGVLHGVDVDRPAVGVL